MTRTGRQHATSGTLRRASDAICGVVALPLETRTVVPWDVLRKIADDYDPTARVAVDDAVPGLDGFRQTHRQALRAQDVAVFARPGTRVTFFSDVGPVALMLADADATRGWVRQILGRLGADDEHAAGLRETLRVFLSMGSSYTATAELLRVHKNGPVPGAQGGGGDRHPCPRPGVRREAGAARLPCTRCANPAAVRLTTRPAHVVRGCARATGRRGCSRHWMPAQSRSNSFAPSIPTPVTAASRRALHQHAEVRVVQPRRFGAAVGKGGQRQAEQILVQATPVGEVLGRCRTSHASVLRLHAETLRRSMASAARGERSHGIAEGHPCC